MGQLICIFSAIVSQQNLNKHYSGSRPFVQPCTTYSLLIWDTITMILSLIKLWGIQSVEQLKCIFFAVISQQELEKSLYKVPDTLYKFVPIMLHLFGVICMNYTLIKSHTDQISGAAICTLFWYYCNPNSWVWNNTRFLALR